MAVRKTDDVLASARREFEAQLAVVREQIARLTAEEHALAVAASSLDGGNPATTAIGTVTKQAPSRTAKSQASTSSTRKPADRRRRRRVASKSTAERVSELRALLAEGPKSRNDLAAALKVSPARVQQLLAELGSSVSSQPDPNQRRGKLWSLDGSGNGASATKRAATRGAPGAKRTPASSAARKSTPEK